MMRTATVSPRSFATSLGAAFRAVRAPSERLCQPLEIEDFGLQSMEQASPTKWHLAHTTWFFETFVLDQKSRSYRPFHDDFRWIFNSYYDAVGKRWPRGERGLIARPTVAEVFRYRAYVDEQLLALLEDDPPPETLAAIQLGVHHEQQHQELMITDLKHAWSRNPLSPLYRLEDISDDDPPSDESNDESRGGLTGESNANDDEAEKEEASDAAPIQWLAYSEGLAWIGHAGRGFAFDNESPRHRRFLAGFQIADRLTTNREFERFIDDHGYRRPEFWLSDGWSVSQEEDWRAPLYWRQREGEWFEYTMAGWEPLDRSRPVCHLSYYEADAFARWAGARLPSEAEWEICAHAAPIAGTFAESGEFHPRSLNRRRLRPPDAQPPFQLYGDVWQWTSSAYAAYPGYRPSAGALGEYNGKFMCNQFVLRGASSATPLAHARTTYRNFFAPEARWQFTGVRLAKDLT